MGRMAGANHRRNAAAERNRSEEHTSELQSPCISYAVFCLKKKTLRVRLDAALAEFAFKVLVIAVIVVVLHGGQGVLLVEPVLAVALSARLTRPRSRAWRHLQ